MTDREAADAALAALLRFLDEAGYDFITPTPATHATVSSRLDRAREGDLRDVFGWSRPFSRTDLPDPLRALLEAAGMLEAVGDLWRSAVRVSRVEGRLLLHSAPGRDPRVVFLGPDTYRFVRLIDLALKDRPKVERAVDIGAGAGAGAMAITARYPHAAVTATDINPLALRLLGINGRHAGLDIEAREGRGLSAADGLFDLIVANPPYVAGAEGRVYSDGGGGHGSDLALQWVSESLPRLRSGGRMILYTGSPVLDGRDLVRAALRPLLGDDFTMTYEELDPDVFGGLLRRDAYREIERIAAVGAVIVRR